MSSPDRFIRDITTFLANDDGSWRRDSERHENVLIDASQIPALLNEATSKQVGTTVEAAEPEGRIVTALADIAPDLDKAKQVDQCARNVSGL